MAENKARKITSPRGDPKRRRMAENKAMKITSPGVVNLIPGLPDEIGTLCLARIPLWHRHNMRCVCRGWRDLFQEQSYWDVRHELSNHEEVILFCVDFADEEYMWFGFFTSSQVWFKLPPMPNDGRIKGTSTFAVVNEKLFVIGGRDRCVCTRLRDRLYDESEEYRLECDGCPRYSSTVSYFDMKLYQWKRASCLNEPRGDCRAGAIGDQLYVCGGFRPNSFTYEGPDSQILISIEVPLIDTVEVYCHRARTWRLVSSLNSEPIPDIKGSLVMGNKFYVLCSPDGDEDGGPEWTVYDPEKDKWSNTPDGLNKGLNDYWKLEWNPFEYDGRVCIKEDFFLFDKDDKDAETVKSSIMAYSPSEDLWEEIISIYVSNAESQSQTSGPRNWVRGDEVVEVGTSLYILHTFRDGPGLKFEIFDITSKQLVTSKSFYPKFLEEIRSELLIGVPEKLEVGKRYPKFLEEIRPEPLIGVPEKLEVGKRYQDRVMIMKSFSTSL